MQTNRVKIVIDVLGSQAQKVVQDTTADVRHLTGSVQRHGTAVAKAAGGYEDLRGSAGKATAAAVTGVRNVTGQVVSLKGALAGLGLGYAVHELWEAGRAGTATRRSFVAIADDANAAARELDWLRQTADALGVEFWSVAQDYKGIFAAAQDSALEGRTREIFTGIIKAGRALVLSNDQIRGSLYAVTQMMSKGKVQAEELVGQLGERLPAALPLAAQAMGVTTRRLYKMLEGGQVLAEDLLPKLADVLHKKYGKAARDAADEGDAALARFRTSWKDTLHSVADSGFMAAATEHLRDMTAVLRDPGNQAAMADFAADLFAVTGALADGFVPALASTVSVVGDLVRIDGVGDTAATGATYGVIGRVLFGSWGPGGVLATVAVLNEQMEQTGRNIGSVMDDYQAYEQAVFRIMDVAAGRRDWNTGRYKITAPEPDASAPSYTDSWLTRDRGRDGVTERGQALLAAQKAARGAEKRRAEQKRKAYQNAFEKYGVLSDAHHARLLDQYAKDRAAFVAATGDKETAYRIYADRITALTDKLYATQATDIWEARDAGMADAARRAEAYLDQIRAAQELEAEYLQARDAARGGYYEDPEMARWDGMAEAAERAGDILADGEAQARDFVAVWEETAEAMQVSLSGVFSDALRGELSDFEDYFGAFTDSMITVWSNMIAEMIIKQQALAGMSMAKSLGTMGLVGGGLALASMMFREEEGPELWEIRQARQGRGTVLGDIDAKSESIRLSLDRTEDLTRDALDVNRGMYESLRGIQHIVGRLGAGLSRQFAVGVGAAGEMYEDRLTGLPRMASKSPLHLQFGMMLGPALPLISPLLDGINDFIDDIPLLGAVNQHLGDVIGNIASGGFSKSRKLVDAGLYFGDQQLGEILHDGLVEAWAYDVVKVTKKSWLSKSTKKYKGYHDLDEILRRQLGDVFSSAADAMDDAAEVFGRDFDAYIGKLTLPTQHLSLKGMSGEEMADELTNFFSQTVDDWAVTVLSGSDALLDFQRAGEGAFETLVRLAAETKSFAQMAEMAGLTFRTTGDSGVYAVQDMAEHAGGSEALEQWMAAYYDAFLPDSDKLANQTALLTDALAEMGLQIPRSREAFREIMEAYDLHRSGSRERFVDLLQLAPIMDAYYTAVDREAKAQQERVSIMTEVNHTVGSLTGAWSDLDGELFGLNRQFDEWVATLKDLGTATDDLNKVEAAREQAIQETITDYFAGVHKNLSALSDRLAWGDLAPSQSIAAYDARYADLLQAAGSGNVEDVNAFSAFISEYANFRKGLGLDYQDFIAQAMADIEAVEDAVTDREQAALDATQDNTDALHGLSQSVDQLIDAMTGAKRYPMPMPAGYATGGWSDVPAVFGEAGGEWAVPDHNNPNNTAFLRSVGADPDRIGAAAGRTVLAAIRQGGGIGGGTTGPIHVHVHVDRREIARTVVDLSRTNPDVRRAIAEVR